VSGLAYYWVDGDRAQALPLPDRGLDFGDGLFETFLHARGRLFYPERHFLRLQRGLKALGFPDCSGAARSQLEQVLAELARLDIQQSAVRMTITRGGGERGYAPPIDCNPRIIISCTPTQLSWRDQSPPAQLAVAVTCCATQTQLAGLKHLNRLEQVLAARERIAAGADEMLMLDQQAMVASVISGNIFAVIDGAILTPPLQNCGVRGTRRALVIDDWALRLGMKVQERNLDVAQLQRSDELFYTNSLVGLRAVASLAQRHWNAHPVCGALHDIYTGDSP
jgi:4-amino-4-deoxychorismate lyase